MVELNKPIGVLDHPARIDSHVIGNHIARQPDPMGESVFAQLVETGVTSPLRPPRCSLCGSWPTAPWWREASTREPRRPPAAAGGNHDGA